MNLGQVFRVLAGPERMGGGRTQNIDCVYPLNIGAVGSGIDIIAQHGSWVLLDTASLHVDVNITELARSSESLECRYLVNKKMGVIERLLQ